MLNLSLSRILRPLARTFVATAAGAMAVGAAEKPAPFTDYERQILAAVLVLEAANQGESGMRAVLHVINNRAGNDPFRAIGVVAKRKAFSCLNSVTGQKRPDYGPLLRRAMQDRTWPLAMQLIRAYEAGNLGPDPTGGATHYCIHPPASWQEQFTFLTQVGEHRFYK